MLKISILCHFSKNVVVYCMSTKVVEKKKIMISGFEVKEPNTLAHPQLETKTTQNTSKIISQNLTKNSLQETEDDLIESLFDQNPVYNQTISTLKQFSDYKLQLAIKQVEREKKLSNALDKRIRENLKSLATNEKSLKKQQFQLQEKLDMATQKLLSSEKFTTIGELTSRFTHDVRNPLSVIQTQLNTLQLKLLKEDDEDSRIGFLRIFYTLSGINQMIERVLDYARAKPLQVTQTKVLDILKLCITGLHIPENIKITISNENYSILCDDYQIGIVFNNLISNAIEALNAGGEIKIKIINHSDNVFVEIQDSGPGIPENIIGKIFEPMFTTKKRGTGLGLASCFRIITQHGGTISVQNKPTRFLVKLPKNPEIT